jgi:glutathione peroxidase
MKFSPFPRSAAAFALGLLAGVSSPAATPAPSQAVAATETPASCPPLLRHSFNRLQDEKPQALCQYAGKVLLVVNTASYCGFTGQYAGLEDLYARYRDQGLVVLGFPSNDFAQESGDNRQIADFCENTYGVKFPMFAKSSVAGAQASPFYRELAAQSGQPPRWNFYKYLIGRDGRVVDAFASMTGPDNARLVRSLERQLATPMPRSAP